MTLEALPATTGTACAASRQASNAHAVTFCLSDCWKCHKRRSRPIFARAEECDTRSFCIERCRREIQRADYFAETHPKCTISDGYVAAIQTARRRIRQAEKRSWLGYRFLGLDACWLSLLGFRSQWESAWPWGGIDAACTLAEELLELTPGTASSWTIEDLYRLYRSSRLKGTWTDGGRIYEPPGDWPVAA